MFKRHKRLGKKPLTKLVSGSILLGLGIGLFTATPAHADANDRVTNFINLAKNKSTDNSTNGFDISKLNEADARFLGVLMSNFYVPFTTEFGDGSGSDTSGTKNDGITKAAESMTSVLKSAGINEANSKVIVEYVKTQVRNVEEPKWYISDKGPGEVTPGDLVETKNMKNNLMTFYRNMSGMYMLGYSKYDSNACNNGKQDEIQKCFQEVYNTAKHQNYKGDFKALGDGSDPDLIANQGKHYAYLVTGGKNIMFSTDLFMKETTPSTVAMATAARMVDANKGYGTSFFDFTEEEIKQGAFKSNDMLGSSMLGTPVVVSPFGDLIAKGSNHQYVMMPGAMNPYTWVSVNSDGDTNETQPAGSVLNAINVPMLALANGDSRVIDTYKDGHWNSASKNLTIARDAAKNDGVKNGNDSFPDDDASNWSDNWGPATRVVRGSDAINMEDADGAIWGIGNTSNDSGKGARAALGEYTKVTRGADTYNFINYADGGKRIDDEDRYKATLKNIVLPYYGTKYYTLPITETKAFTKIFAVDVLDAYNGTKDSDLESKVNTIEAYKPDGSLASTPVDKVTNDFTNKFKSTTGSGSVIDMKLDKTTITTLYMSYLLTMNYSDSPEMKKLNGKMGFRMNTDALPEIKDAGNFELSDEQLQDLQASNADQRDEDIKNWTWYLLNPAQGFEYVTALITNKSTNFLMSVHSNIVGATNAPTIAGSTKYLGFSGYVTVPELTDLPWTDAALEWYNSNWYYIALFMVIILGIYAMTGVITIQKALGGAVLFALLAMIPANLINYTVGVSNNITNGIYGDKFTYWALLQNESYSTQIEKAAGADNYTDYLQKQMAANSALNITGIESGAGNNSTGDSTIVLKWQAPKKMVSLMDNDAFSEVDKTAQSTGSQLLATGFTALKDAYSGESYLSNDSVYLYRSYIDIANYSRFIYQGIEGGKQSINKKINTDNWPDTLKKAWNDRNTFKTQVDSGYNLANKGGSTNTDDSTRINAPLSSKIISDTFTQSSKVAKLKTSEYLGVDTRAFNFSVSPFINGSDLKEGVESTTSKGNKATGTSTGSTYQQFDASMGKEYTNEDYAGLASYALMSESPFYYFSWNLYDQGLGTSSTAKDGYKKLILGADGNSYFYNTGGNQEIRDYTDMRSLFTYVIPYLKKSNDVVQNFDEVFGLKYEAGVPTVEGFEDDPTIKGNPEMEQKYWKNLNISRLYSVYSPWVDLMYETGYAKSQDIDYQGETLTIKDPINPASYPKDRPMVFSKSEQLDWGLKDNQLTTVEKKIQEVQQNTQKNMFGLLNAYNYQDNVLNTAAAVQTLFNFNKSFSEGSVFGTNVQLYPQSFELKNFSYDAFLRLILANSTGDSISGQSAVSFYTSVVQKSSMFTALALAANDVISVYAIPAAKVFGIVALFITSVFMLVASCIRIEEDLFKNILKALVAPLVGLLAIFVGMAWVVSLFMSNGNTAVTGYDGVSISLGDPVMVLLAMLAINILCVFLLYKLFKLMLGNLIRYGKAIGTSMIAVGKGAGSMATNVVKGNGVSAGRAAAASVMGGTNTTRNTTTVENRASSSAERRSSENRSNVSSILDRGDGVRSPQHTESSNDSWESKPKKFNDHDQVNNSSGVSGFGAGFDPLVDEGNRRNTAREHGQSGSGPVIVEEQIESEEKQSKRRQFFGGSSQKEFETVETPEVKEESKRSERKRFNFDE